MDFAATQLGSDRAESAVVELPSNPGDRAPSTSPWTQEGKLWLLTAAGMAVVGLFKGIHLLILLSYLLIGLWIFNWRWAHRSLRGLRAHRLAGEPIFAAVPTTRLIEVQDRGSRPARGWTLEDRGEGFHLVWNVLHLRSRRVLRLRRPLTIASRGRRRIEPLRASSRYPFGLVHASIDLAPAGEIIVLPRLGRVHREQLKQWLRQSVRGDGRARRRVRRAGPQEADVHGLRDFRPGDSPRWIHWRTSARRNQLLVREFEDTVPADLILVMEPWLPENPTADQRERLEQVISLAATICREWCREPSGRLILVIARSEAVILDGSTGAEHALRTMEATAVETGSPDILDTRWIETLGRTAASMPMLALSSASASSLADAVAARVGRAVASAEATEPIGWYEIPSV